MNDELTSEQDRDRLLLIAALTDFRDAEDEDEEGAENAVVQLARTIQAKLSPSPEEPSDD